MIDTYRQIFQIYKHYNSDIYKAGKHLWEIYREKVVLKRGILRAFLKEEGVSEFRMLEEREFQQWNWNWQQDKKQ